MNRYYDVLIVGQGLAGTTLAWKFVEAGLNVFVVDSEAKSTSSRVAAGLITPITGKRFALSTDWKEYWQEASTFYGNVEKRLKSRFFYECQMLRLFANSAEREVFERKLPQLREVVTSINPDLGESFQDTQSGGFEMQGGRLDVTRYLNASRQYFVDHHAYQQCFLDVLSDLIVEQERIWVPSLDVEAKRVVFCQGFQSIVPTGFESVRFNPAKGEILDIQLNGCEEERVVHCGMWLAPTQSDEYRIGATYDWDDLSTEPTAKAREWLTSKLNGLVKNKYQVLQQLAAIRPTMHDFQPVIGFHPDHAQLGFMNGLGSKGSLMAPRLARLLIENVLSQTPIPQQVNLLRWFS